MSVVVFIPSLYPHNFFGEFQLRNFIEKLNTLDHKIIGVCLQEAK